MAPMNRNREGIAERRVTDRDIAMTRIPVIDPRRGGGYFRRSELDRIIPPVDTSAMEFQAVAFNFPNYHPSPAQERYFGKDWTEWQLVDRAKPLFPGHLQPKRPLWGAFNEADPSWAEQEIDAAADAGIHAFMIDWYWYDGTQILQEQLEQGMLKALNRDRLKFAIMWANLDWNNQYPPPATANNYWDCATLYKQKYSPADMDRIVDYWLEHYLLQSNYWRLNGQPVVQIYDIDHLLKTYSPGELRGVFDRMRDRCVRGGAGALHLQTCGYTAGKTPLKELGLDSATHYHTFDRHFGSFQINTFADGARQSIALWEETAKTIDVPYFPDCPVGWDNSCRFGEKTNVFVERTPDQYELLLEGAKRHLAGHAPIAPVVFLSAWNEWSEDHYLLPDDLHGYGYLEAVRRQFGGRGQR
jgi:hypothetical protein